MLSDFDVAAGGVTVDMTIEKVSRACLYSGLGLCWAAEEALSFRVAPSIGLDGLSLSVLYAIYLCFSVMFGLGLVASRKLEGLFLSCSKVAAPFFGIAGLLALSVSYEQTLLTCIGVCLFVIGSLALNFAWFNALSEVLSAFANKAIVSTAFLTFLFSCIWDVVPPRWTTLLIGALLVLSYAAYGIYCRFGTLGRESLNVSRQRKLSRTPAPVVGVAIIAVGFAYLQYGAYNASGPPAPFSEAFSHGISFLLLAVVVYVVKDSEHTVAAKIASTCMLCAFVFAFAFKEDTGISFALAAGCEGMMELVVLLALAQLASYREMLSRVWLGSFLMLFSGSQLVGCVLEALTHGGVGIAGASVGMALVVLLILTAVWLLNDRMVTRLLWPNEHAGEAVDGGNLVFSLQANDEATEYRLGFDEKANKVALAHGLTQRESEVMCQFAKGRSSSFIAEQLFVSSNTVRSHISHVYSKCGVHSRQELISLVENVASQDD